MSNCCFISFDLTEDEASEDEVVEVPPPPREAPPPPPPTNAPTGPKASTGPLNAVKEPLPAGPKHLPLPPRDTGGPLGSRKRTANDEIKPPDYGQLKKISTKPSKGMLLSNWQPKSSEDPCPWATVDHSATTDMAFR